MKRASVKGFTIIEVMLFLAVTGGLFAALMIGVGSNLTQERYREGASNTATFLQDQYNEVNNPRNEYRGGSGDNGFKCTGGEVEDAGPTTKEARGTSECVLLGKAIMVKSSGTVLEVSSVIGIYDSPKELSEVGGDIAVLKAFNPKFSDFARETKELDAGVVLKTIDSSGTSSVSQFSMLILRSPLSGLLHVFVGEGVDLSVAGRLGVPSAIDNMIDPSNQRVITQCIAGDTGSLPTALLEVDARIAGPDGIAIDSNGGSCANVS